MKKLASLMVVVLALGTMLSACSSSNEGSSKPTELVISTWGFAEDAMKKNVYEPFEKEHNVKIVTEIGNNSDRLNKVRQGSSKVDVIFLSDYYSLQGIEEGLFEKLDYSNIPNADELYDIAKTPLGADYEGYGPAYTVAQLGLVVNEDTVKVPVESWNDMWNPEFQNKIALPNITITSGPMLIDMAAKHEGNNEMDTEAAFKALKEINPGVVKYFSKTADVANMFAQGEIEIAPLQDTFLGSIQEAVPSAKFVTPKEGAYALMNTVNVVKGSENKELAEKFINWVVSQDVQKANALDRVDSPANKLVELTAEEAEGLTYGAEVVENLNTMNLSLVNQNMSAWIDRWNRELE